MVYQQCGSLCPQTCDNIDTTVCISGCAEGCFCPDGLVADNGNCIEPLTCPGIQLTFVCLHCYGFICIASLIEAFAEHYNKVNNT